MCIQFEIWFAPCQRLCNLALFAPSKYKIKTPSAEALGEFILMKSVVTDQLQVFVFKTSNSQLATH